MNHREVENRKDIDDVVRFALDLKEDGWINTETARSVIALLRGPQAYRPQAVSQALVSYLVNRRRDTVRDPIDYIRRTVELQQERLYGKKRKQ